MQSFFPAQRPFRAGHAGERPKSLLAWRAGSVLVRGMRRLLLAALLAATASLVASCAMANGLMGTANRTMGSVGRLVTGGG